MANNRSTYKAFIATELSKSETSCIPSPPLNITCHADSMHCTSNKYYELSSTTSKYDHSHYSPTPTISHPVLLVGGLSCQSIIPAASPMGRDSDDLTHLGFKLPSSSGHGVSQNKVFRPSV